MFFNKFFGENRIIFYFTASYGLGNALIELAVINYLYPFYIDSNLIDLFIGKMLIKGGKSIIKC